MSTVDFVEATVRDRLLRGELGPGIRLRQDELAEELGVSKIPVREALQRLAGIGLLEFEANRGARVPVLTSADAEENFALRLAIEPLLLERAVAQLTIVDLAEAELALDQSTANPDDTSSPTEANWAFHRALYAPAAWNRGLSVAAILHASVAPYVLLYLDSLGGSADSDAEHHALLDACRNGDASSAVALLNTHLRGAADALIEFLRDQEAAA